jgi:transmembrane sensor
MDVNDRRARATREATHWWTRLGTKAPAEVSEVDRLEFTQWLRESPLHVAELLHVAHVYDALERFKAWEEIPLETQHEDDTCIALPSPHGVVGKGGATGERARRNHRVTVLLAASAAALAVSGGWLAVRSSATTVEADRAERREVVLTDGSVVSLEPETTLRVNLEKHRRYVTLTRGRALFHVAKDSARPFIVHAGNTNVRALGTTFGVEQRNQSIIVTVSEGKVAVVPTAQLRSATANSSLPAATIGARARAAPREGEANDDAGSASPPAGRGDHAASSSASSTLSAEVENEAQLSQERRNALTRGEPGEIFLTADQQVTVPNSGAASQIEIEKVDSRRALAWSQGRLVFDSTPLSEVAEEFNRYNQVQLRIRGDELGRRTISGIFKASDPQTLIDFIAAGAHVIVTHRGNEEIVISPGP